MMRLIETKPDATYEVYGWNGANFIQAPVINQAYQTLTQLGLLAALTLISTH